MIIFTIIFRAFDIFSKLIISKYISINENVPIIKNFLNITNVRNTGVAWSLFDNQTLLVLIISTIVIIGIIIYIKKNKPNTNIEKISYSMILGGALGNLIERLVYSYVTDFIDIHIFGYNYPIFNLADTFIVIGAILLIIISWRNEYGKNKSKRRK